MYIYNMKAYFKLQQKAASLAVFRVFFGILMFVSIIRFWSKGWIETIYIAPKFHFTYYGFGFVKSLGEWNYLLFVICGLASLLIIIGYQYKWAMIAFFLSFTYIELIDKTTYLNHYYFISALSFILIFLPLNKRFALDAFYNPQKHSFAYVPKWTVDAIKLLLGIVYFYAGLAKINSDWLLKAQPLKIWLSNKYDFPVIGRFFHLDWVHYAFSWSGMLYDLCIPFLLLYKPTRKLAFISVVIFHLMTYALFNIGMFPFIMIVSTSIFFSEAFHENVILKAQDLFKYKPQLDGNSFNYNAINQKLVWSVLALFFCIQILLPWRYLGYPGELFWTEEGFRFSWRVMLIEKVGMATFTVKDPKSGIQFEIDNRDFLTPFQIKQMSTQPDFILQYAHYLRDHYQDQWIEKPEVYADVVVTLNGRLSKKFVDSNVNLANEKDTFASKKWILPFNDEIKGL